jgi:hypothetical protein
MFQIEDLVAAALNDGSLDFDAIELQEMMNVVSLQVNNLLSQYNVRLSSRDVISLYQGSRRAKNQSAADPRESYNAFQQLLFGDKWSTYVRSILDLTQTATGMGSISKLTILPKMSLMMGFIEAVRQSGTYLVTIGFSETIADQLYNGHHHCKDIFACILLVTLYGFFMKLPSETGSQILRGIRQILIKFNRLIMDDAICRSHGSRYGC